MTRSGEAERDPEGALRANRDDSARLVAAAAAAGLRFVFLSTDLVFPGRPGGGYREDDATAPLSAYGRSKLAGEQAVLAAHPAALVTRTSLLIHPDRGYTRDLAAALARGPAPLFVDERRSPILAADLARALLLLAALPTAGVLHVAGPRELTRLELGTHIARDLGLSADNIVAAEGQAPSASASGAAARPSDVTLDSSRARTLLPDWRPRDLAEPGAIAGS
jgi:dTDP-4-dehydrorhamnose reductase